MSRERINEFDEISELFWLIEGHAFKPYSQYPQFNCRLLSEAIIKEIQKIADDQENHIIAVKENHRPVAFCIARKSSVESEVFRKKIYAITHLISTGSYKESMSNKQKLLRFFKHNYMNGIRMVSCRANSEDFSSIHALEKEAYYYMDSLITYTYDLKQPRPKHKVHPFRIRPIQNNESSTLKKIVRESQFIDRFHNDPHIPKEESDQLYEKFIDNAVKGIGADMVLVAEYDDTIAGFNTIESLNRIYSPYGIKIGSFVLNAVAPEFRNRGVYSSLMNDSILFLEGNADLAEIRTHAGNSPVHRALPKIGFRLSLSQLTFHSWNSNSVSRGIMEMHNE